MAAPHRLDGGVMGTAGLLALEDTGEERPHPQPEPATQIPVCFHCPRACSSSHNEPTGMC